MNDSFERNAKYSSHTCVKALARKLVPVGCVQLDLLAISTHQSVLLRVEGQVTSNGKGGDQLRGCHKGVCGRVAIVTRSKVAVVRGDDGVCLSCMTGN